MSKKGSLDPKLWQERNELIQMVASKNKSIKVNETKPKQKKKVSKSNSVMPNKVKKNSREKPKSKAKGWAKKRTKKRIRSKKRILQNIICILLACQNCIGNIWMSLESLQMSQLQRR